MMTIQLELPSSVQREAEAFAQRDGVTMEQLLVIALAEKMASARTTEALAESQRDALRKEFQAVLAKVPRRKPMKGDELPPDVAAKVARMKARYSSSARR